MTLPRSALLLVVLAVCCGPQPEPRDPPWLTSDSEDKLDAQLELETDGEALLELTGEAREVSWGTANAEAVVVTVIVDGKRVRHLIWTDVPDEGRRIRLGRLSAGQHQLTFKVQPELNRGTSPAVRIRSAELVPDPNQELARHAPVLLGREDSHFTDLPALVFAHKRADGTLSYQVAFTNEDGGTAVNPPLQFARWGRLADLEWALDVKLDGNGEATARTFQGFFHGTFPFTGPLEDGHALLRVATTNGVFADDGKATPFKLAPPLIVFDEQTEPRERVMDLHPWLHRLADQEARREQKVDETCTDPARAWTLDCYLFVDLTVSATAALEDRRVWGVEVKAGSLVSRSEGTLGAQARLDRTGEVRVAIPLASKELPTEVSAYFVDDAGAPVSVTAARPRLRRWNGEAMVDLAAPERSVTVDASRPAGRLWP